MAAALSEQVVCFTVIGEQPALKHLRRECDEHLGSSVALHLFPDSYSGWSWLTICQSRATKDQAIEALKRMAGLDGARVTVFGDNTNDLSMFVAADRAIAVGNAIDEVKKAAHQVIGTNQEESVVRFIAGECARLLGRQDGE